MNKHGFWYSAAAAFGGALLALRRAPVFELAGKVVIVTGGSRGLGLVMARELVARGAKVAICARDGGELERAHAELAERGEVIALECDVTDRAQVERFVARVRAQLGPIDAAIHNAGVIQVGPMEVMRHADYERALQTHFWAALHLAKAVLPDMIERGSGRIVHIASIGGKIAVPHLLPYSASKFALVGFSEGLRAELARHGVAVTTAVPGLMRTGSAVNARFRGQHREEYAWFSTLAGLRATAMTAERAARKIVDAMVRGEPEVVLSASARLATRAAAIAPRLVGRVLAAIAGMLPEPPYAGSEELPGSDLQTRSWIHRSIDRTARRNNELKN